LSAVLRLRTRRIEVSFIVGALLLVLGPLVPITLANTGGASVSPSPAPSNTTISIQISASATLPTPSGYDNVPFFVAVLTPSGHMFGCISGSSACDLVGFTASSPGTYQCVIPFGGASSSLAVTSTGGVSTSDCSGSNAGTWTGMSSTLCGGVFPDGANCVGTTGFNDLVTGCTGGSSYAIGFGNPNEPGSTGDTSQAGTYSVVVCWDFATQDPNGGGPAFTSAAYTNTFQITPSTGVPEFPVGLVFLVALSLPVLLIVRAKSPTAPKP
jgi:hypothetical protein